MATCVGACALGLAGRLGELAPGHRADLVLLDPRCAALAGAAVTLPQVVQHAGAAAVAAVMVEGRWVLRDGRILAFDEDAVLDRVARWVPSSWRLRGRRLTSRRRRRRTSRARPSFETASARARASFSVGSPRKGGFLLIGRRREPACPLYRLASLVDGPARWPVAAVQP